MKKKYTAPDVLIAQISPGQVLLTTSTLSVGDDLTGSEGGNVRQEWSDIWDSDDDIE